MRSFWLQQSNLKEIKKKVGGENTRKVTFHRFPKDVARRAAWIEAVHRKDWLPSRNSMLCSHHFTEDCFDRTSSVVVRLWEHAVPSIFPSYPENLQNKAKYLKERHDVFHRKQCEIYLKSQPIEESIGWKQEQEADSKLPEKKLADKIAVGIVPEKAHPAKTVPRRQEPLLQNLCRFCAEHSTNLVSLFGDRAKEGDVVAKIHAYLPIMVTTEDVLPVGICEECLKKLDDCHNFVKMCLSADKTLRRILSQQDASALTTPVSSKQELPVFFGPTVVNPVQPLLLLMKPVIPQSAALGTPTVLYGYPQYWIVPQSGQSKVLKKVDEALSKDPPMKETHFTSEGESHLPFEAEIQSPVKTNTNLLVQNGTHLPLDKDKSLPTNMDTLLPVKRETHSLPKKVTHLPLEVQIEPNSQDYHYCDKCHIQFDSMMDYIIHQQEVQCTYKCSYCSRNFRNKKQMANHELSHLGERPYKCETCGKGFRDPSTLRHHTDVHLNKTYECEECGKKYNNRSGLYWHSWTHSNAKYLCPVCGELVPKGSSVYAHKKKHSVTCSRCTQTFENRELLKEHEKSVHELKGQQLAQSLVPSCLDRWKCKFCSQSFNTPSGLSSHYTLHKYNCFVCKQMFKDESELSAHRLQVHGGKVGSVSTNTYQASKMYEVDTMWELTKNLADALLSGKVSRHEQSYKRHKTDSARSKPIACTVCGKTLKNKYKLLVHKQVHNLSKPYRCSICHARFGFYSLLKKHRLVFHAVPFNSFVSQIIVECYPIKD